ncbi:hypothetical protein ACEPAI_2036 [Sanghuangporus weigelae]
MHANKLSDEVLCNIFLNSEPRTQVIGAPAPISAPITISHVCRRWRKVALSIGELWSFLDITLDPELWKVTMDIFFTWLQRSGRSPLNYSLKCVLGEDDGAQPHLTAEYMVKRLISHQARWENVWLDCSALVSFDFPGIRLQRTPMLKSLNLDFHFETYKGEVLEAQVNVAHSPHLEELKLSGSYVLEVGRKPIRNMSSLSNLQFYGEHSDDSVKHQCLNLLRVAPNLQLFRGSFIHSAANVISQPLPKEKDVPFTHEMEFLILEHGNPAPYIIDKLTLPFLKSLHYDGYDTIGEGDILLKFVQRSLPPLTYLWISTFELEEDKLISILRLLPALRDLGLKYMALTTQFFREFTPRVTCDEPHPSSPRVDTPSGVESPSASEDNSASVHVTEDTPGAPACSSTEDATDVEDVEEGVSTSDDESQALDSFIAQDEVPKEAGSSSSGEVDRNEVENTSVWKAAACTAETSSPGGTPKSSEASFASEASGNSLVPGTMSREIRSRRDASDGVLCPALRSLELDWLFLGDDNVTVIKSICEMAKVRSNLFKSFDTIQFDGEEYELPYDFNDEEYEKLAKIVEDEKWVRVEGEDAEWMRMH